jgi:hypothetical protein
LKEYVPFQPTNAAPVTVPVAFARLTLSRRTPEPSKRSDAVAFSNGSAYAVPFSIVIAPKPIGAS